MLTIDPLKLPLVAIVALVVLGPDKLPALARRVGSLLADLERLRASLREHARLGANGGAVHEGLRDASEMVDTLRRLRDPQAAARQALYRAVGIGAASTAAARPSEELEPEQEQPGTGSGDVGVPGSIDLGRIAPHLLRSVAPRPAAGERETSIAVDDTWQPGLFDPTEGR